MSEFASKRVVAIGEAMVQMAPVGSRTYAQSFAGDTFNTAWHIAQLLRARADVGFLTRIGTDSFSDAFDEDIARDGLDRSAILREHNCQMGLHVIALHCAERSFHYWRQHSAARHLADDPVILRRGLEGAGSIHVSGVTLAILSDTGRTNLLRELIKAKLDGAKIRFDPNVRPRLWSSKDETRQTISRTLEIVDIALPSFDDEAALRGDTSPDATLSRLGSPGVPEIVVKNGSGPVSFLSGASTVSIATPPAPDVLDTTGAGDAFNAGYLASRVLGARGRRVSVATSLDTGSVIPMPSDVRQALQEYQASCGAASMQLRPNPRVDP